MRSSKADFVRTAMPVSDGSQFDLEAYPLNVAEKILDLGDFLEEYMEVSRSPIKDSWMLFKSIALRNTYSCPFSALFADSSTCPERHANATGHTISAQEILRCAC